MPIRSLPPSDVFPKSLRISSPRSPLESPTAELITEYIRRGLRDIPGLLQILTVTPHTRVSLLAIRAAIFDLDGVIADTAELHFQSWMRLGREIGVDFDRRRNERLRGVAREASLEIFLEGAAIASDNIDRRALLEKKNAYYLELVEKISPHDALPGVLQLIHAVRRAGLKTAVASSSRNAMVVLARLELLGSFDAIIDGNMASKSKPDPEVFKLAADALHVPPAECAVIEDAQSGVAAARAAGMRVIGIGPNERVGDADRVIATTADLTLELILGD